MAIKPTKDYSNLIGGEQKYVCSTFTLESNGQLTIASKMPTWQYFLGVLVPRVCPVEENLSIIFMEIQTPRADKLFFLYLYKAYNLYILMDFYLIFWRRVCPQP
jgi:hypothetical protein